MTSRMPGYLGNKPRTPVVSPFASGTSMVFQQTAAPTGWTKQTTHDNKAMRLVSGTPSSGGSVNFDTLFVRTATDTHTMSVGEIATHIPTLSVPDSFVWGSPGAGAHAVTGAGEGYSINGWPTVNSIGSSTAFSMAIDMRVKYVDFIIANKN